MCRCKGGVRRKVLKHTYIQSVCIYKYAFVFHGMASLCIARHTSIWLSSIFFSPPFSLSFCLSSFHSSIPINTSPIPHPIHINSTTSGFVSSAPHPSLIASPRSVLFFLSLSNQTLFSLSPLRSTVVMVATDRQTDSSSNNSNSSSAAAVVTLTHAMTSIKSQIIVDHSRYCCWGLSWVADRERAWQGPFTILL